MIRRHRHAGLSPSSGSTGGDIEALQTDAMRFMSIIALCLMAVFALVQGIPVQNRDRSVQPSKTPGLPGEIQQAPAEHDRPESQLENLDQHPDRGRQVPGDSVRASKQKAGKSVVAKRSPPAPAAKPVPARRGFSLRFASTAVLDRLVSAGSVILYGMAGHQAWRLSIDAGTPAVTRTRFPTWFHEMSLATVPARYIYHMQAAADGPGKSDLVWGVQLPAVTRAAITSITRAQQGGALVIRSDGQVMLEE